MLIHIEAAILKVFWLVPPNTWKNLVLAFYYSNVLRRCSQNFDLSFHEELSTHSNYHFRRGFVKSDCGFLKKTNNRSTSLRNLVVTYNTRKKFDSRTLPLWLFLKYTFPILPNDTKTMFFDIVPMIYSELILQNNTILCHSRKTFFVTG